MLAAIFGMNVSVISLICVIAWKTLTTRPATSPKSSTGPASTSVISSAPRPMPTTVSIPIVPPGPSRSVEALQERAHEHVPAVHQHEQHELERQRDQHRWQHHHAHRGEDRRHHHVEDEKRHVDQEAHLE